MNDDHYESYDDDGPPPEIEEQLLAKETWQLASKYVKVLAVNGRVRAFNAACAAVKGFGFNQNEAIRLMETEFNASCKEPLSRDEVCAKVEAALLQEGENGWLIGIPEKDWSRTLPPVKYVEKPGSYFSQNIIKELADQRLLRPIPIGTIWKSFPTMRKPVVHGLLRRGETCNIIASPKIGKSFLAGGLAWSIAQGIPWMGFDTSQGRVLLIDNELHPETLSARHSAIANAMGVDSSFNEMVDVLPLRGFACGVAELSQFVEGEAGKYALIIIDALYRTLPEGTSENDNAQMMQIYNHLDRFAAKLDAAIVVVHHSTKGDQSSKDVTDMGSGAGSIARAADTHVSIRPHEELGFAVLEARTRSSKPPEPVTIAWEYPLWHASIKAAKLKNPNGSKDAKQSIRDKETDDAVLEAISKSRKPLSVAELRSGTGWQNDRLQRAVNRLEKAGKLTGRKLRSKSTGKSAERFSLAVVCSDGCSPESDTQ